MPNNYIKSISSKYNIPVSTLEKDWKKAKEYADSENQYGLITHIFKNIINKHHGLKEEIKRCLREEFTKLK